jgi:nitrite reductase/ring-hydroxylating ferredoxin subunit
MGTLMRHYWIPGALSSELPEPDGAPMRLRLLGEDLIAFRVSSGQIGVIQNNCPHRGASLFFGRNEEEGLRCVYHGWKFNTEGACVDMPNEPAESDFKTNVKATSKQRPTAHRSAAASCGVTWARTRRHRRRYPTSRPTCCPRGSTRWASSSANATTCKRLKVISTRATRCSFTPAT